MKAENIKKGIGINVYDASNERLDYIFSNFERIYLSFSGGKDSGVMLNMILKIAKEKRKKIAVLIVDTEAHYDYTYSFLEQMIIKYKEQIELYWICLPLTLDNTLSCFSSDWICWDNKYENNWIRNKYKDAITDYDYFNFYYYGMSFYEFIEYFAEWFANNKKTCSFVGLRAEESQTRAKIFQSKNKYIFKNTKNTDNIYPLCDWKVSDIWKANYVEKFNYNKIYDLMNMAGIALKNQRVGQLFGNEQKRFLSITRILDQKVWVKMLYRVNGVDFTSRLTESGALRNISKPLNKTWEEFALFICNTLPRNQKYLVKNRISKLIATWKNRDYIAIPEECPKDLEKEKKVISWRMICKSLLKNDFNFNGYGVTFKQSRKYENFKKQNKDNLQKTLF